MAEAKEIGKKEHFFMQMNGFSRDLLIKQMGKNSHAENVNKEEEEIELSLGLSLNGKFGVDPEREAKQRLIRSSSISNLIQGGEDASGHARVMPCGNHAPLTRTCSLPAVVAEEEWRKRKEMQTLRRMEVKRKRMEKKNVVRDVRGRVDFGVEENFAVSDSVNGDGSIINGDEQVLVNINGDENHVGCNSGLPSSQGSIGSQGSGSSGISDLESQPLAGANKNAEARSPSGPQSLMEQDEQKTVVVAAEKDVKDTKKEVLRNPMLDMPCVSTRVDGPEGKRVDGFLYRYRKGEEVNIVCVCHGSFLSPAEFVKHAGGGDVANPLRHIVINPSTFL